MAEITSYRTLAAPAQAEFKDKGSRFLAYGWPIQSEADIRPLLDQLRADHPKAVHWCYAWRLGADGARYRANDDGEPSGSAGRPILGQIDSAGLTQVLVVVVRYFGGTLLGVPGLIQAYKSVTADALAGASIHEQEVRALYRLQCGYPVLSDALRIARQHQAEVLQQELLEDCVLTLAVPLAQRDACLAAWAQTRQMDVTLLE